MTIPWAIKRDHRLPKKLLKASRTKYLPRQQNLTCIDYWTWNQLLIGSAQRPLQVGQNPGQSFCPRSGRDHYRKALDLCEGQSLSYQLLPCPHGWLFERTMRNVLNVGGLIKCNAAKRWKCQLAGCTSQQLQQRPHRNPNCTNAEVGIVLVDCLRRKVPSS